MRSSVLSGSIGYQAGFCLFFFLGFQWKTLSPGSVVVDVGGGQGHNMLTIRNEYPKLKFVVQDRAAVMEEAKKVSTIQRDF